MPGTVFMNTNGSVNNDLSNPSNDASIFRRIFRNLKRKRTKTKTENTTQNGHVEPKEETFNLQDIPLIDDGYVNDSPEKKQDKEEVEEEKAQKVKLDNDEEETMESKFLMDVGVAHEIV